MKLTKIKNPVSGAPHRVRIDVPSGFEYTLAEMASGTVKTNGPVRVAENGLVKGDIYGSDIRVGGTVSGNLVADGQVILGKKSILNGDIIYRKLLIEDGAQFSGKCDLITEDD